MKRFLSFLTVCSLLISMVPALMAHAHDVTVMDRVTFSEDGEVAIFQETEDVWKYLCDMLVKRIPSFAIRLPIDQYYDSIMEGLYDAALRHSDRTHKCGDSVRWQAVPTDWSFQIEEGYVTLYYSFAYLTTAQEEEALDVALSAVIEELACNPENRYNAVKTVYDWVCANVSYVDNENAVLHDYTAYGALINRSATGQGFALLMYQIFRKLDIACHVVPGTFSGQPHSWNVVYLDSNYYNIDAALDAGETEYGWFLKSDAENLNHERDPACDQWYVPHAEQTYVSPEEICREFGHEWCEGKTCMEHDFCNRCGLLSEGYGNHSTHTARDGCDAPFVCNYCKQIVVGAHNYEDDTDEVCNSCGNYRRIMCPEDFLTLRYTVSDASEEPEIYTPPGVVVTLTEEENDVYHYTVKFPKTGTYGIEVQWSNGREPETFDILVTDHDYRQSDGICSRCGKDSGTVHVHNWIPSTCYTPETCSECGETRGEPKPHYFYNKNCTTQPSVCEDCGYVTDGPPGHVYWGYGTRCLKCDQLSIPGCNDMGVIWWRHSDSPEGYRLVDTDPKATLSILETKEENGLYGWKYAVVIQDPGLYEVTFEEIATGERETITAVVNQHEYSETDGICYYCQKRDPERHFHDWKDATCTEPRTCTSCGATEGRAEGHWFSDDPCTGPKTCNRCGLVKEAPSHFYSDEPNTTCSLCGQRKLTVCEGTGVPLLLSSSVGGDFTMDASDSGCSLVYLEYFVAKAIYYWECIIYTPGPGLYELPLHQKNSDEPFGVTLNVIPHEYVDGICKHCGGLENAGHIHTWKSATCTQPAVCTECGEKNGTPLNHDFSKYVCSESAKCARCGKWRSKIDHTYDGWQDDFCNVCNRQRVIGCQDDEIKITVEGQSFSGFHLVEAPPGVYMKLRQQYSSYNVVHVYEIFTPNPGVYEVALKDVSDGKVYYFTVERRYHQFENGVCQECAYQDKSVHHHYWKEATCVEPATCMTCGVTKGEPAGHRWYEATCEKPEHCWKCGITRGEPLGHDFMEWSCLEPAFCGRCNLTKEEPAGHAYEGDEDMLCDRCGQTRVLGCRESELEISITSAIENPFVLLHPRKGVSISHVETLPRDGQYIHTYRIYIEELGAYELTLWQESAPEYEVFTAEMKEHLYKDGKCRFCGEKFVGILGDVDGNGKADYSDALLILRASIGLETLTEEQKQLSDVNSDGRQDYSDALQILRASIGL